MRIIMCPCALDCDAWLYVAEGSDTGEQIAFDRIATLAANLAVAAMGCLAFKLGASNAVERCQHRSSYERFGAGTCNNLLPCAAHGTGWRPGCGRAVDGWGGR